MAYEPDPHPEHLNLPRNLLDGKPHCPHPDPRSNDLVCCWCGDVFWNEWAGVPEHGPLAPPPPVPPPTFTLDEVLQILRNKGVDTNCGACMAVAFTASGPYQHTCRDNFTETLVSFVRFRALVMNDRKAQATLRLLGL